ncbi:Hpt domain-containing protein [uncultured Tateyamaria sp.]|uniref:Hpt domain-containing protein n=1 Tax=uncultured Tateyamaria sp. TaxID=455651 RepID=UPI00262B1FB9|nr:Hpt domain-containing protein [uncultured Tateyamaria sp.]
MIDWQRVTSLRSEIGEEDFEEVVPLFLEEVAEITDALRADVDLSALEANLHALKGSAMNLGFSDFSSLCHTGEAMAASGNAASVDVTAILNSFDASKDAFLNGLAGEYAA